MHNPILVNDDRRTMRARIWCKWRTGARAVPLVSLGALAVIIGFANPAHAHAAQQRTDLPLPVWQVAWAGACAVAISFVAVGLLWHRPRLLKAAQGRALPGWCQQTARALALPALLVGLFCLVVVAYAGLWGNINPSVNIAPTAFYILFWVGLPILSVLLGDFWKAFNPIPLITGIVRRITHGKATPADPSPSSQHDNASSSAPETRTETNTSTRVAQSLGHHWWAVAGLVGFAWLELSYHDSESPRAIGVYLLAFVLVMIVGTAAARRDPDWSRNADTFGTLFGLMAAMGPLHRDQHGTIRLRPPMTGLAAVRTRPGTEALILVALGATTFDGLTSTSLWSDLSGDRFGWDRTITHTLGLVMMIGVAYLIYRGAIAVMANVTGESERSMADLFAPSLTPIVVAYIFAHYFSYLMLEGQAIIAHVSDPFGKGWDLFGTATRQIDFNLVSAGTVSWVQTLSIVVGHVLSVMVAHDRAVERFSPQLAVRSQYPMLAAMVAYTVIGLLILLGN